MKPKNKKIKLKRIKESIKEVEYKKLINAVKGDESLRPKMKIGYVKSTSKQVVQAIKLKQNNTSNQVANKFGVARSTLLRHIAKQKRAS